MEKKRKREIKYRTLICSAAGAFFCGFGANWGSQLDRNGNVAVTDLYSWLIPFLTACVLTPVFYLVVEKLTGIEASGDRLVSHSNKKAPDAGQQLQRGWKKLFQSPILRYAIILFLCWQCWRCCAGCSVADAAGGEKLKLLLRTRTWYHRQPAPLGQKL